MSEWILVSERLPEEGKGVLIQFKSGRNCPHNNITIANIGTHDIEDNNFIKKGTKTVWYTDNYYYDLDRVIAWIPLPEPYREPRPIDAEVLLDMLNEKLSQATVAVDEAVNDSINYYLYHGKETCLKEVISLVKNIPTIEE